MSHYYTKEGESRHFVEMSTKPGQFRPTRVSDAKKHKWIPSVTTILDILGKPALVNWKVDKAFETTYHSMPSLFETLEDYKAEMKQALEAELSKAPEAGTNVHQSLEDYFNGKDYPEEHNEIVENVLAVLPKEQTWIPEERVVSKLGFAGTCDLHSKEGEGWVIDYKTKQTKDKFKKGRMAFPDHSRQLAAYREAFGLPKARCANIFICIETGEVDFHEHKEEDLKKGWETFKDILSIWKRENFDSSFKE